MAAFFLMCLAVNKFCLIFGIYDFLAAVKSVITGYHVADSDGDHKVGHSLESEELEGDEQGRDGTVCYSAENTGHAAGRAERGRKVHNRSQKASQDSTRKEGGDDLSALKTGSQRQSSEKNFQKKSIPGHGSSAETFLDHGNTGADEIPCLEYGYQEDDQAAADEDPQVRIFEILFIQMF